MYIYTHTYYLYVYSYIYMFTVACNRLAKDNLEFVQVCSFVQPYDNILPAIEACCWPCVLLKRSQMLV